MRITRFLASAVIGAAATFGVVSVAGPAFAEGDAQAKAPSEAGTSFRTAKEFAPGQRATASASTGDYLYWSFPADAGQRPTVKATVKLPDSAERPSGATWRVDVYDGLRRRQACMYGVQSSAPTADATSVNLSCTLRTVRAWADPWANDPLPGTYYVRLTAVELKPADQGLPVSTEVEVAMKDVGGSAAVDGSLAAPLVPGSTTASATAGSSPDASETPADDGKASAAPALATGEPEGGWSSGWWSDRWIWTAAGGILAALAGVAGYALTRGRGRPSRVPQGY
ncbi:hypothetical protein [Streptomyces sp. NPDC046821]|uniref:hypothetical protein n=1 Tax=Streptomyces sp. NPDC046821 TaxID=3154702 RepID=UPI0033E1AA1D